MNPVPFQIRLKSIILGRIDGILPNYYTTHIVIKQNSYTKSKSRKYRLCQPRLI